jgi:hypothetical protein
MVTLGTTPEERKRAAQGAQEWGFQATGAAAVAAYRGKSVAERQSIINALEAKGQLDPTEGATLQALKRQQGRVQSLSTLDRMLYSTGSAAAPVNLADPGSVQARAAAVDAAKAKFGGAGEILNPIEAAPLLEVVQRGSADDKITMARQLAALGPYGGRIAQQITPHDPGFRAVLQLAPMDPDGSLMRDALNGPAALKGNTHLLTPEKLKDGTSAPNHQAVFTAYSHDALTQLDPDTRSAVAYNATNIYLSRAGAQGWTMLHPQEFIKSVNLVLGARYSAQGWTGGMGVSNGRHFVLPTGWSQQNWDTTLARATPAQWTRTMGGAITRRDGSPVQPAELARLPAVYVGKGHYALATGPNTFLTTGKGKRFEFDPGALAQ